MATNIKKYEAKKAEKTFKSDSYNVTIQITMNSDGDTSIFEIQTTVVSDGNVQRKGSKTGLVYKDDRRVVHCKIWHRNIPGHGKVCVNFDLNVDTMDIIDPYVSIANVK